VQDLLDDHRQPSLGPIATGEGMETLQIPVRIAEPVDMVDPERGHDALPNEPGDQLVCGGEHAGVFDAHADDRSGLATRTPPGIGTNPKRRHSSASSRALTSR